MGRQGEGTARGAKGRESRERTRGKGRETRREGEKRRGEDAERGRRGERGRSGLFFLLLERQQLGDVLECADFDAKERVEGRDDGDDGPEKDTDLRVFI